MLTRRAPRTCALRTVFGIATMDIQIGPRSTNTPGGTMEPGRRLAGKTALLIGGTGYMGSAFSRAFAAHGARIVLASRTGSALDELALALRRDHDAEVRCVVADVGSEAARLAEEAWDAFGVLD